MKSNKVEQWIICFNTHLSVLSIRHPQRVRDMLAYASLIAKASREYEGTPWLVYARHFHRLATAVELVASGLITMDALPRSPKSLETTEATPKRDKLGDGASARNRQGFQLETRGKPYEVPIIGTTLIACRPHVGTDTSA